MQYRFADFVVDEERRELRLGQREIAIQPRVFDLLVYLIRHRDRVVGKDELLEALWPGTVVVDGALQRVTSLARSALAEGGARLAIRTYARRGYRFCEEVDASDAKAAADDDSIERARRAYLRHDWQTAADAFGEADGHGSLSADDLERWAQSAQWLGNAAEAIEPLERAIAAYLASSDGPAAARAAVMLSQIQFERLELPVAKGWLKRAFSFLDESESTRELGLACYAQSRLALAEGALDDALRYAERTLELGLALGDRDLEALGLAYRGHALLSLGNAEDGVDALDEAAAAALAGNLSPWAVSLVYCSVIWACRNRGDWDRAARWTDQFNRWCERSGLKAFPGTCRLHRAEVLSIRGELAEAEREIDESTSLLAGWAPWAEGDAYRVLGDLRLTQGDLDGAERAFRRAHELGWDPQPGLALLRMARGKPDAAVRSLTTALTDRSWANRERRALLLAILVLAAAAASEDDTARTALAELDAHPELWSGTAIEALVHRARGEVAFLGGLDREACDELRSALNLWRRVGSPYNAAITQSRLAAMLKALGDAEAAELERSSAAAVLDRLGMSLPAEPEI